MTINKGTVANLCVIWAFALLLGLSFSLNIPLVLLIAATILFLI